MPVHIDRIFQHSLVCLTGSDVAILTVEMFCLFSAPASTSHASTEAAKALTGVGVATKITIITQEQKRQNR